MPKKQLDEKILRKQINEKHMEYYAKIFNVLNYMLAEVCRDIKQAEFEFIDIPKNTIASLDFLISAIGKVQKGERLALGMDNISEENIEPEINIIEGLSEEKI